VLSKILMCLVLYASRTQVGLTLLECHPLNPHEQLQEVLWSQPHHKQLKCVPTQHRNIKWIAGHCRCLPSIANLMQQIARMMSVEVRLNLCCVAGR
jgi:hypothetical protein